MKLRQLLLLAVLLLAALTASAQFVNFGQDRPSLRWKQIKTDHFQLIYPDFFETNAQRMANLYARLYAHPNTLQQPARRISIIIHPDGGISNGNVALAPRKSELYTMPPQDPSDSWLEHLCVHEFRHIVQFDKINRTTTRGGYYLFGDIFPIAVVGLYVPMWFMEGDAVCFETAVGQLGRGRSPEFLNEMKAQIVDKGIYNFQKAILGSYKDFVPNRYTMGYFMTANSRLHYGTDIWAKALARTARYPFSFTPFAKSLQLTMLGKRDSLFQTPDFRALFLHPDSVRRANTYPDAKRTLYHDNFDELRQIWIRETAHRNNHFDTIATHNKYYTNYYYPTPTDDGKVIAYKQGVTETGAFVEIHAKNDRLLTRTGNVNEGKFALADRRILWSEYRPHLRWALAGRMNLSTYDLVNHKYKKLRSPNNQFAPFATDHGWGIVEVDRCNRASIVLLDTTLRHVLQRIPAGENQLFLHPSYADGRILTAVQSPHGIHLESIDPANGQRTPLTAPVHYELDNPIATDNGILYRASYDGNNAFYHTANDTTAHLLDGRYGVRFPLYDKDSSLLYFSFYTADGYKPARVRTADLRPTPPVYRRFRLADSLVKQENWSLPLTPDSTFATRRYSPFTHLLNLHSWGPMAADLNDMEFDIGAVVYSQNKLSTLSFVAGYALKSGYDHGAWMLNATYSGWWPVIGIQLESGRYDYNAIESATHLSTNTSERLYLRHRAHRSSADLTVHLPLNLSARQYNRTLQPYVRYKIEGIHAQRPDQIYLLRKENNVAWLYPAERKDYRIDISKRYYQLMEYGINFNNQTRTTEQEINPRWGQNLSVGYTHAISGNIRLGSQWWADGRLYFPAITHNHSLSLYGGFQQMSDKTRNFDNKILYPRGITLPGYEIATTRNTYRFPLWFPDRHIGSLLYFKSIDAGLFYDFGSSRNLFRQTTYSSYGMELTTDTHFFRLTYPIHIGFRTGYETQSHQPFFDLIFSIGLSI